MKIDFYPISWRQALGAFVAAIALLGSQQDLSAKRDDTFSDKGRGMLSPTQEELNDIDENGNFVIEVKPNKIGANRIHAHRKAHNLPPISITHASGEDEFTVVKGKPHHTMLAQAADGALPTSVNNSGLACFPPIGNQGSIGSCSCWATTYYMASHEYGLLNGINNKGPSPVLFSPKFSYNLINGGGDNGSFMASARNLLMANGGVTLAEFPYDSNFLIWDLNPQHWVEALSRRFQAPLVFSGANATPQNLTAIKQMLVNGHVLNMGTCIDSWIVGTVQADPSQPSNPYVGQKIAIWQNGNNGAHSMTIVGYDDTIWVDINNNGVVDPGEKGAFLIANQWGPGYANRGYIWIAYDAFLGTSAVAGGPSLNRTPLAAEAGSNFVTCLPLAHSYTPKLIAQFTLTQSIRDQITVVGGISDTSHTTPTKTMNYTFNKQGGNLEFDGTAPGAPQTATFALDFTDLLPSVDGTTQRYYITVTDSTTGNPTTLNAFTLEDLVNNKTVACTTTPVTVDQKSAVAYIDYAFSNTPPPAPPTVAITSPRGTVKVWNTLQVIAQAQDPLGIKSVEFFIDGNSQGVLTVPPYQEILNFSTISQGTHVVSVVATNNAGITATATVNVYVAQHKS